MLTFFLLYLAVKRAVADGIRDAAAGKGTGRWRSPDPRRRYARGEISQEEYERMRRDVEGR